MSSLPGIRLWKGLDKNFPQVAPEVMRYCPSREIATFSLLFDRGRPPLSKLRSNPFYFVSSSQKV